MKQFVVALICAVFTFSSAYAQDAKKKKDKVTFFVEGMECANCQKKVEKNISFEKGVTDMKCDLTTRTVEVTYKTDKTSKTKLASAFKKIGMEAVPVDDGAGCPVSRNCWKPFVHRQRAPQSSTPKRYGHGLEK